MWNSLSNSLCPGALKKIFKMKKSFFVVTLFCVATVTLSAQNMGEGMIRVLAVKTAPSIVMPGVVWDGKGQSYAIQTLDPRTGVGVRIQALEVLSGEMFFPLKKTKITSKNWWWGAGLSMGASIARPYQSVVTAVGPQIWFFKPGEWSYYVSARPALWHRDDQTKASRFGAQLFLGIGWQPIPGIPAIMTTVTVDAEMLRSRRLPLTLGLAFPVN